MKDISVDLNVLLADKAWEKFAPAVAEALAKMDVKVVESSAEIIEFSCQPDNMLLAEYQQKEGHLPIEESLQRVVINCEAEAGVDLREVTKTVVSALPQGVYWYGSANEGHLEPGADAACQWRP